MSKQPPPAPTALALLLSKFVGRPGTGSLPSTIAPPGHPRLYGSDMSFCVLVDASVGAAL